MSKRLLTDEQHDFFVNACVGRTTKELSEAMYDKFGITLSTEQIRGYKTHHNIKSGVDTRFKKGILNEYNKDKLKDVGDTFISKKDGYHYVKLDNGKWVKKQRYIYEQAHGVKLSTRMRVIFLDGDKNNFDIDNLKAVDSRTILMAKNKNLFTSDKETTETGLLVSELILKTFDKKKCLKKM